MWKKSNNSSMSSNPNHKGFYMGDNSNLMTMMQNGGQVSRGASQLARARQERFDTDRLEDIGEEEARRQGRGKLFGSVLGLGGGLLAAALAPATGGLSLLAPAVGTALGKGIGERFGAGRARDYDTSGTVFGQEAFRDVDAASRDYNRGIMERAGLAGLKAGITAGLAPSGGIYGKVAGKLRPDQLAGVGMEGIGAVASQSVDPYAQFGDFTTVALPKSSIAPSTSGFAPQLDTSGVFDASQQLNQTALNIAEQEAAGSAAYVDTLEYLNTPEGRSSLLSSDGGQALMPLGSGYTPDFNLIEALGVSLPKASPDVDTSNLQSFMPMSYEDTLVESDRLGSINRELDALRSLLSPSLPPQYAVGRQDGGLVEYQYGGGVDDVETILNNANISPTPEQLALFEKFDTDSLNTFAESMKQNLLLGNIQASEIAGQSGFSAPIGGMQKAQLDRSKLAADQFKDERAISQKNFESGTLAQAAADIRAGVEYDPYSISPPVVGEDTDLTVYQGSDQVMLNGNRYYWVEGTGYVMSQGPSRPSGASDVSLKENINLIGSSNSGINIYTFEYKNKKYGEGAYQGVMAQEVPWASYRMRDGYLAVDYNKVDVDFIRVS